MAIQTRGFTVDNMPRFTPADPTLVAFNPTSAADGMLQTFQLANSYEKLKASKALQAELEATRKGRIAAEDARNSITTGTAPGVIDATNATNTSIAGLQPFKTAYEVANLESLGRRLPSQEAAAIAGSNFTTAEKTAFQPNLDLLSQLQAGQTRSNLNLLNPMEANNLARLSASTAQYQGDLRNAGTKELAERMTMDAKIKDMQADEVLRDNRIELARKKLDDQLAHFTEDQDIARATKEYDAEVKKANAAYLTKHGDYFERGGAARPTNDAQALSQLQLEATRLETSKFLLPNGDITDLAGYRAATRNPDGSIKQVSWGNGKGFLDWSQTPVVQNPRSSEEAKLLQYQNLLRQQDMILARLNKDATTGAPDGGKNSAPALRVGDIVDGMRWRGGNPNDPKSWEAVGGNARGVVGHP